MGSEDPEKRREELEELSSRSGRVSPSWYLKHAAAERPKLAARSVGLSRAKGVAKTLDAMIDL